MKNSAYIVLSCFGTWGTLSWFLPDLRVALLLGMLVPMAMALANIVLIERTYRRDPVQVTGFMVKAFVIKMIVCGAYVGLVLALNVVPDVPFVISFTVYFLGLHFVAALHLKTLFREPADRLAC